MANNNNQIDTFLLTLECLCSGDDVREEKMKKVRDEFRCYSNVESDITNRNNIRLNQLLRASRAMETSMEVFLLKHNNCPANIKQHTMGGYMDALFHPKATSTHSVLPSHVFAIGSGNTDSIRNRRNTYLHQAGIYPSPLDVKRFNNDMISFLSAMIVL